MSGDLHARFDAWLAEGALGDPPRDAAIHASVCPECLHKSSALDALRGIDLGLATLPPSRVSGPSVATRRSVAWARGAAVAAVVVLAVVTGAIAAPLFSGAGDGPDEQQVLDATGTPEGAVAASTDATASADEPSATPSATPAASGSESPTSSAAASIGVVPQPPVTARPSAATARPSATATPRSATPRPTAAATPTPTPLPTPTPTPVPTPTPTPVPDDCADGIDNDGDLLIDALDPGCAFDGNEDSA